MRPCRDVSNTFLGCFRPETNDRYRKWAFFFLPSESSFLPLIEEKKQKKIKASPRPRKLAGYMIGLKNVPGKTSLPRQGPFLVSRQEKKIIVGQKKMPILGIDQPFPTENTRGAYCIRPLGVFGRMQMIGIKKGVFFLALMIFFSSLDGRKEAKEDQGLTEAGELGRVCVGVEKQVGCTGVGAYCIRPLDVSDRKRSSQSSPNKLGHRVIRPLVGTSGGRMRYAPTRVRSFGSLHVPGQIRRRPQTPVCNTPLQPDTCLEFLRSAGR